MAPPMHLRFKRKDTTVFFLCEPSDTFLKLKLRVRRQPVACRARRFAAPNPTSPRTLHIFLLAAAG